MQKLAGVKQAYVLKQTKQIADWIAVLQSAATKVYTVKEIISASCYIDQFPELRS